MQNRIPMTISISMSLVILSMVLNISSRGLENPMGKLSFCMIILALFFMNFAYHKNLKTQRVKAQRRD